MIIVILLLLIISLTVHIIFLVFYIMKKTKNYFYGFFLTALSNILIGMTASVIIMKNPNLVRQIDLKFFMWLLSGFIMFFMLGMKIFFVRKILKRRYDPRYFHYNYFGKKVYQSIIKKHEYFALFLSIPFFLLLGAYFLARLINIILYGHI